MKNKHISHDACVQLVSTHSILHCDSASHSDANLALSLRTIEGGVSKWVVTQRHIVRCPVALVAEHSLSEHFAKQQSAVMIPSHIVIYLPIR